MSAPTRIGRGPAERGDGPRDPLAPLVDCHARIRQHLALSRRLVEEAARHPPDERGEAARQLERYFTIALPLHAEDEERSLAPRLLAAGSTRLVDGALELLERMAGEHRAIDELVETLVPSWRALYEAPARESVAAMGKGAARLDALLTAHIEAEERALFPAARSLGEEALGAIAEETRQRRGGQ